MTVVRSFNSAGKQIEKAESEDELLEAFNKFINVYNSKTNKISISSGFNGYIAENVVVPASNTLQIEHFLGVKPKWRIILRQEGNGLITDVFEDWTTTYITLKNNGIEDVTLSLLISRE